MSILQLLPLNELGYDNSPYNAISTFALEPMYISLKNLKSAHVKPVAKEIAELKKKLSKDTGKVNYGVKILKTDILKKIYRTSAEFDDKRFTNYISDNFHWLKYYCIFKILTELNSGKTWLEWEFKYRYMIPVAVEKILQEHKDEVKFHCWVQWQLYEQMKSVKRYAKKNNVFIMGDIPFLVSRNSADVWAYKNYFKLHFSSGAPPDMYFSQGQRWGMPPYNWMNIEADQYGYLNRRLKYAENFYDMFRIDHFVGLFRVWTIDMNLPDNFYGLSGKFDPEDEHLWESHGKKILEAMLESTSMLPCAEDLGTVPDVSYKVLSEYGIPGVNVQRWEKKFVNRIKFIEPGDYRINSVATVSTHDSSSLPSWFENEAGTIEEFQFRKVCEKSGIPGDRYEKILSALFEQDLSSYGRLLWKNSISGVYKLLGELKVFTNQTDEFVDMYLSSFGEREIFLDYIGIKKSSEKKAGVEFILHSLEKIFSAHSVFCINLITEYLFLDNEIRDLHLNQGYRFNFPGTVSDKNWTLTIPIKAEELKNIRINELIRTINVKHNRK